MQVYGLYVLHRNGDLWSEPLLFSTNIKKLREVMVSIVKTDAVYIGTTDITNSSNMNSHTKQGTFPFAKIVEMPTLI